MLFPYMVKMNASSFTLVAIKAIGDSLLVNFLDALLPLTLCYAHVFEFGGYTKVINI